ncbi:MAG TPA: phage integrase N-terminal domain-containing protein [Gammaproteobacteria bacterium]|nr:phage integrase N-terminal domain-containing protein [Gammaproteobacteria bacterium]
MTETFKQKYGRKYRKPRGNIFKQFKCLIYRLGHCPSPFDTRKIRTRENTLVNRKRLSIKTFVDRKQSLLRIACDLMLVCLDLPYITRIKRAHVLKLLGLWQKRKIGVSAVKNYLAYLRTILWVAGVDAETVVPSNKAALAFMGLPVKRTYVNGDKSWESRGIDPIQMIRDKVMRMDPLVGTVLFICVIFGFRLKEAMLWRVFRDVAQDGSAVFVRQGAKSGRKRKVAIKCGLLEKMAISLARRHTNSATGSLIPGSGMKQDQDLKKFKQRIYKVARKCGITKKMLGITIHGLRHSAACRWYLELTGEKAPIQGGGFVDPILDRKVREIITRRLGHVRLNIVDVYIGKSKMHACER